MYKINQIFTFLILFLAFNYICIANKLEPTPYRGSELPLDLVGDCGTNIYFYLPKYVDILYLKSFPVFSTNFVNNILSTINFKNYIEDKANYLLIPKFSTPGGRSACRIFYESNSSIYGLGTIGNKLIRNNQKFFLWNTDAFGFEKDAPYNTPQGTGSGIRTYQSHPWILGVQTNGKAFGIFFATSWRAEISIASNFVDFISDGPPFPVVVIQGESPQIVLKELAKIIGTMPLPPLWALGFHQSRWSYNSQDEILSLANEFSHRKIPCSAIWCDIDYMEGFRIFTSNKKTFPHIKKLASQLQECGIKLVLIVDPAVKIDPKYETYLSGTKEDVWIKAANQETFVGKSWAGECVWPDFISERTKDWWKKELKKFITSEAEGVAGLWLDMNEPSVFDSPDGTIPCNALHYHNKYVKTHTECHNLYANYMAQATFEALKEINPTLRPFILTRAGFSGIQRYAASWTGDSLQSLEHLKLSISMCLNAGLSLQPFIGADVGGFSASDDTNSLALWMGVGAFYPFFRIHTIKGDKRREPWSMGEEIEAICRKAISIRYRLLPYIYTQFYKHTQTGLPIIAPLFFIAPEEPAMHNVEEAFLFGEDIVVILPWADQKRIVSLISKKEQWRKFEFIQQDSKITDFLPKIFIRRGAIIPMLKQAPHNALELKIPFEDILLVVVPDNQKRAQGVLYEDEGDGYGYLEGKYALTEFVFDRGNINSIKQGGKLSIPYNLTSYLLLE